MTTPLVIPDLDPRLTFACVPNRCSPPASLDMQYFKVGANILSLLQADITGTDSPLFRFRTSIFQPSAANTHTTCGWKGVAHYYDVHLQDGTVRFFSEHFSTPSSVLIFERMKCTSGGQRRGLVLPRGQVGRKEHRRIRRVLQEQSSSRLIISFRTCLLITL